MKHPVRPRHRRKSLFPEWTAEQRAAALDESDELIRLGFPELSRCDHCDMLDGHTQRLEVKGPLSGVTEKHWLHEDCAINFDPEWRRCACYNDGLADGHYFRWEGERGQRFVIQGRR
jgi:hypothetical protein